MALVHPPIETPFVEIGIVNDDASAGNTGSRAKGRGDDEWPT